ncbi:MAG: MCE family protein [Gemmatimonadetes bacterium]|nr:MCE family protein [Gemmatimonadota bacterium]
MKRRNEVLVGLLTLSAIIIVVLGSVWIARGGLKSGYRLYVKFPWSAGLKLGQPVLLGGVTVGFVEDVDLRDDGVVVSTLNITIDKGIPKTVVAMVEPNGVFGDRQIALRGKPSKESWQKGDTIPAGIEAAGIDALLARMDTASERLADVVKTVKIKMVDQGGIEDLRKTLERMNALAGTLGHVVEVQSENLTSTMATVKKGAGALDSTMIDSTVRNLRATTATVAKLTEDLRGTTARVNALLAKADSGGGTIGKLLNDPGLYDDLRRLSQRMDTLTADFKANPRKYIKFSVF